MAKLAPRQRSSSRALRAGMTDAEQLLWQGLRNRQLHGARFRRQHPVGPFVADFACVEARLVVEVDGGQHAENAAADSARTAYLRLRGWQVLRYWNHDVLQHRDVVLEDIARNIASGQARRPP
jgi:primosomal protein N' (replication factor Y)